MSEQKVVTKKKQSSFISDVLKLVSGTTFAQLLTVLSSPILARMFSVDAFGLLAPFVSIASILGVVTCMRYELSIMLPEDDSEAANLLVLSLGIALLVSLVNVPIFWLLGPSIAEWLKAPELNRYWWLIPPVLIFGGVGVGHPALNYWASRTRRYKELSITRVIGQVVTTGYQLGSGFAGFTSAGSLIGASVLGAILSPLVLGWQIWREDKNLIIHAINWRDVFAGLKRYKKFPLFSTWSALLNNISWQLPTLLLSAFFSSTIVGYYALGFRILQVPMSLIGNSLGQVFFQRAAELKSKGKLANLVEEVFRRLVMLGLFPMLMLTIIGRDLYTFVFGENWAEAGVYTQILSVWAFFWFISSPMSTLFSVLEKQEFGLKLNIAIFITRLCSLAIGGYFGSPRLAIALFAISGVFVYGFLDISIMIHSGVSIGRSLGILGKGLMYFAPFGILIIIIKTSFPQTWILLSVVVISFGCYGFLLLKYQPDLLNLKI